MVVPMHAKVQKWLYNMAFTIIRKPKKQCKTFISEQYAQYFLGKNKKNASTQKDCAPLYLSLHKLNLNQKINNMSVCVNIRTKKQLLPTDILNYLVSQGEQIIVTSDEFPTLQFGTTLKAIRGVEITKEDNGYEVRVCSYGTNEDYQLFARTIQALMTMTGGKAYLEDDEDEEIMDPLSKFDAAWIEDQMESSLDFLRLMTSRGHEITLFGLFCNICIGARLFQGFDIPLSGKFEKSCAKQLVSHLCDMQWDCAQHKDTKTRLTLKSPSDETALTISLLSISEGKVNDFDYIAEADVLGIVDMDNQDVSPVFIPFREVWKVLPEEIFAPLDEYQYKRVGELTPDMLREMMERGRVYMPEDLYHKPIYPGKGFSETQRTFILMWNPSISSVTLEEHQYGLENLFTEYFNWSVWDYEKARCGDRFFLVRVGGGRTGIVMSGVFDSHPYQAEDWSGKGRPTFYMDMLPNVIIDPETAPMLQTAQLAQAIPTFDWSGGHSGRLLSQEEAQTLETLWEDFLKTNKDNVDGRSMSVNWHEAYED